MGQTGHIMAQKGLKMHEKKAKNRVFGPKIPVFSGILLSRIGRYPFPPLTENHSAQKLLVELGGTPRPLNGKNPLSSILQVPFKHKYEFTFRLCSFPSPDYFSKPCDMHDTIKPFCYTRLNEVFSLISNHFAGSDVKTNIAGRLVLW